MAGRRLSPEERAAWAQVARTVKRLPEALPMSDMVSGAPEAFAPPPSTLSFDIAEPAAPKAARRPVNHALDSSWERQIRQGNLAPERSIDLHGHTLVMAHRRLDRAIGEALADQVRVLLVVTGKARERDGSGRGAIRAEIGHWIDASPWRDRIASVRQAHPRHGGGGALYLILRQSRLSTRS